MMIYLSHSIIFYRAWIWVNNNFVYSSRVHGITPDFVVGSVLKICWVFSAQALVSLKKCMPPPLPYFKVNICPLPLPHFATIFFAYLWSFLWPNYIVTLSRYFSFRLPHLNIPTGPPSDELDKNSQRTWLSENYSHWNGYSHFRFALDFSYAFGIL